MRTQQIVVSVLFAIVVAGYTVTVGGYQLRYALLAPVTYVIIRWTFAIVGRTRYYLYRNGRAGQSCPNCGGYITRQANDWILTCHRCGWKKSLPLLRWITSSVPANQLQRTISLHGILIIAICAFLILTPALPVESTTQLAPTSLGNDDEGHELTDIQQESYERAEVRQGFQRLLNQERQNRGLDPLKQREELQSMGQSHAENMAENDYMGHVQPDGDTIEDRYREHGLLPECRLSISGTDRYYPGAENAYQGYVNTEIRRDYAPNTYVGDEEDLAQVIFESWMNSKPHREAMLVSSASKMGLGVTITSEDKVFVALELC